MHALLGMLPGLALPGTTASAATLTFTATAGESVVVTGTPRLAIDVGGVTRYATYAGGSGTSSLSFSYQVQPGDFDANGIEIASPIDLDGGTLTDVAGNPPSALTFAVPDASAIRVQTYTAAFTTSPITNSNATAVSFAIAKAPVGASFSYTITSSGGAGSVAGSGTIGSSSHSVSGLDVSSLPAGTLTLSVTVSTAAGGTGAARTAVATPNFTGVLDGLPATAAAFSVRRLRGAYAGPLLRVRRATDNATQDVGSTIGGNLDTTTLAAFCGTATCYVPAWYDQSGNGRDATPGLAGWEPSIVTGGVLEQLGNRPAVRFDVNISLAASNALANANEYTVSMTAVERTRRANFTWRLLNSTSAVPRVLAAMPWLDGALYFDQGSVSAPSRISTVWPVPIGTPFVATFQNSSSAASRGVYLNGDLILSGNGYAAASDIFRFGDAYGGHFGEIVLFPVSTPGASRLTLERDQGAYYEIAVQ